jgi:hypothetical protein
VLKRHPTLFPQLYQVQGCWGRCSHVIFPTARPMVARLWMGMRNWSRFGIGKGDKPGKHSLR